jgi:hypothetical protein
MQPVQGQITPTDTRPKTNAPAPFNTWPTSTANDNPATCHVGNVLPENASPAPT